MKFIGKLLAGLIGGIIAGFVSYFTISMLFVDTATLSADSSAFTIGFVAMGLVFLLALILAFTAQTAGKAWRRSMLLCAAASAFIPISAMFFSVGAFSGDAETAGAVETVIGGGLITGFSAIVGLVFAVFFVILAMLFGRETKVVIVERYSNENVDYRDSKLLD